MEKYKGLIKEFIVVLVILVVIFVIGAIAIHLGMDAKVVQLVQLVFGAIVLLKAFDLL